MGEPDRGEQVGGEERVAPGVSVRTGKGGKRSLRIAFQFRGVECKESLGIEPSAPNVRYAVRRRGEILNRIALGTFNYADYFPTSPRARRFGFAPTGETVGDLLVAFEATLGGNIEASTWRGYKRAIDKYLVPWFGRTRVRDLSAAMIRTEVLAIPGITLKTARNILTPLSNVIELAIASEKIEANPFDRLMLDKVWPRDRVTSNWEADPFTFEEMVAIFGACAGGAIEAEADHWRFAFGSGLRTSEQIALPWAHCDLATYRARIEVAEVVGLEGAVMKEPKTKAGRRVVNFTAGALEALQRQHERTGASGGRVWLDARHASPWRGDAPLRRRWERILRKAGVRYRNPYQTRHTFASALLAAGRPPMWVAKQLGHETVEMCQRNYGRWIEQGSDPDSRAALAAFFAHPSPAPGKIVAFPF